MTTRPVRRFSVALLLALLPAAAAASPAADTATPWTQVGPTGFVVALAAGPPGVAYSSVLGKGAFQTSNDGASWTSLEQGSLPACLAGWDVLALAADPSSGALYAGTYTGIFRTLDGGGSWQPAFPGDDPIGAVGQIVPVPGSPGSLLAVVGPPPFNDPPFPPCAPHKPFAVQQTVDAGGSWSPLALPPGAYAGVAVDPGHAGRLFVGALVPSGGVSGNRAVIVELEGAAVVRTLPDLPVSPFPGGLVLRVDSSTTPSTLFAVATGQDRAVYRAVPPLDPGAPAPAWTQAAGGLPAGATVSDLAVDPAFPGTLHAATSAGVFVSHDRGASWAEEGTGLSSGPGAPPLAQLAVDSRPFGPLYVGTLGGGVYRLDRPGCPIGDAVVCLNGSRFAVSVTFRVGGGPLAAGHAVPLTGDTAAFWFFSPTALELVVKVLDGEPVDGRYWVFGGGLSDVSYTVRVTDLLTGAVKLYPNPHGSLTSFADVFAFPVLTPAPAASPARAPAALETALAASALSGPVHAALPAAGLLGSLAATECPLGAATSLCLDGSRFQVEVSFSAAGLSGNGQAARLTDDTGFFWFLSPANLELAVKVLDGRAVNGHFWIFSGALTDFHYVLKITDTATGAIRTYDNPAGRLTSFVDTSAF